MNRFVKLLVIVLGLLFLLVNCGHKKKIGFIYQQNFSPGISEIKNNTTRLEFRDVREEGKLSNWNKANWMLADNGVRVIGSRNSEVARREKSVMEMYQGHKSNVTIRGFRIHWLTLSMGNLNWCDYTVSTSVKPENQACAGIAFRYLNAREYYAFLLDPKNSAAKLVLRRMDKEATLDQPAWDELKTVPFLFVPDMKYDIQIEVNGDQIRCLVEDSVVIKMKDTFRTSGKIALIADDPVFFGPVTVKGKMYSPQQDKLVKYEKPVLVYELPLPGIDVERRLWFRDVDSDGENEIIIAERNKDSYAFRCLEFNGTELWKVDDIKHPLTEGGDYVIQVFDINGDGKNEILTAIDFQIQVRDGTTGNLLKSTPAPDQNPYFDSRDYPYPKLLGDAICPVKISPDKPSGFYLKDRYTNIWLYDNNLNQLWHKAIGTGHFPLPVDIDKDGNDEIMVNHSLLKADGSVIWNLPLSDHIDNIAYVSLNPGKESEYFYLAAGEMGLIKVNPITGEIVKRLELGHIQAITVADFLKESTGLELIAQTYWREDRIFYLFDKDLNLKSTWQPGYSEGGMVYPLPLGENGQELGLMAGPESFIFDPFTGDSLFVLGHFKNVFADKRWGNLLIATEEKNLLKIYSASKETDPGRSFFLNSHIQSGYLPVIKTKINK